MRLNQNCRSKYGDTVEGVTPGMELYLSPWNLAARVTDPLECETSLRFHAHE